MMQDYPKVLGIESKVGFTTCPSWLCYSPCKNNALDAAASIAAGVPAGAAAIAESDQYFAPAEILRLLGASIPPTPIATYLGIPVSLGPRIVFSPSFALFPCEIKSRFPFPESISMTSSSSLVIEGDVTVESLKLDGALKLTAEVGSRLIVKAGHMVDIF
jgi:UDP-sugar pyrophosphorylase